MNPDGKPRNDTNWSRLNQWLLWIGLASAVIWLVAKHGAHLLEVSPFLLLLACPLLHLFGHGGHGGHGAHDAREPTTSGDTEPAPAAGETARGHDGSHSRHT